MVKRYMKDKESHLHLIYIGYLVLALIHLCHAHIHNITRFETVVGVVYMLIFLAAMYLIFVDRQTLRNVSEDDT